MKDFIEISGKDYRVEVNWNTISDFLELRGYKLSDLAKVADFSPTDINTLLWCAINEGERLEGNKCELSIRDMGAQIGPEDIGYFFEIFQRQYIGPQEEGAKESKKKGNPSRWSSRS